MNNKKKAVLLCVLIFIILIHNTVVYGVDLIKGEYNQKYQEWLQLSDEEKYYYQAVKWATDNKIVNGYNEGTFGPDDNILRQDLATILRNYARYKNKNINVTASLTNFKDYQKVDNYANTSNRRRGHTRESRAGILRYGYAE